MIVNTQGWAFFFREKVKLPISLNFLMTIPDVVCQTVIYLRLLLSVSIHYFFQSIVILVQG